MKRDQRSKATTSAGTAGVKSPPFPVVGIGASAGGLEAFSELLKHLPADAGMAYVLIQHMAPDSPSMLPELLARTTSMQVLSVREAVELERDHVYVLAPAKDVVLAKRRLKLVGRTQVRGVHLPIDHFFRSLASEQGRRAIGVVLSGAASDGTLGLQEIKAEGGITMVQDPTTARYDGMPRSAIAAGCVDMVLPPPAIAAELARLGTHPYLMETAPAAARTDDKTVYADILGHLRSAFGVDFGDYKMSTIRRRVERRIALNKLAGVEAYVEYLAAHPVEVDALYQDILIMVTDFYRDPETYVALREVALPLLVQGKPAGAPIRVWVPGCASGEEAYSIAIDIIEYLTKNGLDHPLKLFATDINERDIARARRAIYAHSRLASVPPEYVHRYFVQEDDGYQVREEVRERCVFARHDVTLDAPFSHIDLISCRNLLIYLSTALQEKVLAMLHYALGAPGVLMLGSTESVGSSKDLFEAIDEKRRVYVRKQTKPRLPSEFAYPQTTAKGMPMPDRESHRPDQASAPFDPLKLADSLVMNRHTPPGVVIDEAFTILQFRGHTDSYLRHSSGKPTFNLLAMARDGLEGALRRAVAEARESDTTSRREQVTVSTPGGPRKLDLIVEPISGPSERHHFLVLFVTAPSKKARPAPPAPPEGDHELAILRSELDATREHLESLVAEKDTVVEELRAANEEIQSSNEELQSINEELETAKEELQSTNEELRTVNEEIQVRNEQLSLANDDLTNLLQGMHVPVIMVDRELRLRRATPEAERLISMTAADTGRPIDDFHLRLDIPDLPEMLRGVIDTVSPVEREVVDDDGRWYSLRALPYQTRDARIAGAIVALLDIDELHRNLERVADAALFSAALERVGGALRAKPGRMPALDRALAEAAAAESADSASLMLRTDGRWQTAAGFGLTEQVVGQAFSDADFPHAALAAAARSAVAISHVADDDRVNLEIVQRLRLRSLLAAPVLVDDEVAAVLVFNWHVSPVQLSEGQTDFAGKVALLIGLALQPNKPSESG